MPDGYSVLKRKNNFSSTISKKIKSTYESSVVYIGIALYTVWCGRFLCPFLHRIGTFEFLKTRVVAAPKEWFSSNIDGGSSWCGDRCPPIYHTHREEERSKTKIKPRKLKDSNHKPKLRSNKIKRFKTHYKPKY